MTPPREHGTPAGDAFLAIQKLARATGGDVQELLTLYALEGLLARVAASPYRDDFVLKGGVLLAAFSLRRPTKDIDLQATGFTNEVDDVLERVRAIAVLDLDDGLVFDSDTITASTIRDEDDYAGVRVRLNGQLGKSRLTVGSDVNFGDPIWPHPTEIVLPRLIETGREPVRMLGYPLPMVIAKKTVTAIQRGEANTRWRDFDDVLTISRHHEFDATELHAALTSVADHRATPLQPLLPALAAMGELGQARWAAWRRRQAYASTMPEHFDHVLEGVSRLVDPVLSHLSPAAARWSPVTQEWIRL